MFFVVVVFLGRVDKYFKFYNIYIAVALITAQIRETHKFFQRYKPWDLKDNDTQDLAGVIALTMENLRVCGILMQPIVPSIAAKLLNRLAVPADRRTFADTRVIITASHDDHDAIHLGSDTSMLLPLSSFCHQLNFEHRKKIKMDKKKIRMSGVYKTTRRKVVPEYEIEETLARIERRKKAKARLRRKPR